MSLGGKNVSDFDNKTLKLVSPRFMSVVEDDAEDGDTVGIRSITEFNIDCRSICFLLLFSPFMRMERDWKLLLLFLLFSRN